RLARIDFVPGGNWSEAAAGTNAIGTALADGHVVQLMASEHYCDGWQDLTCTAAPIRHPLTGDVIGILDVTGNYRLIRSFLTGSLAAAALEIEQKLRILLTSTDHRMTATFMTPYSSPSSGSMFNFVGADFSRSLENNGNNSIQWQPADEVISENAAVGGIHDGLQADFLRARSPHTSQERRVNDAESMAIAAGALSASLDVQVVLEKVAEQATCLLGLEGAAVCLFNETDEGIFLHGWSVPHLSEPELFWNLAALLDPTEAVSLVRERGEPVIIDDVLTSTILPGFLIEQMGIRSLALLPLVTARGVIGFIAALRSLASHWEVDDVRLGLALAAQSATAIENARLFEILQQHNRRIEVLNTMAQLFSTLPDLNQHLDLIVKRIAEVMTLETGIVFLRDQSSGSLTLAASCGLPTEIHQNLDEFSLPLHEVACLVVATGESLLISGIGREGHIILEPLRTVGLCDVLAVPLAASNTTLGVLLIGSHTPRKLTEENDLALFTTIGQQFGLALKNAELLRSTSEIKILREADKLKSDFLSAVSHDLRSPLTAIRTSVESLIDRKGIQATPKQEDLLQNIAGQTDRLGQLVDQLLDLSRIEAGVLSLDRDWTELPILITDTIAKFEKLHSGCRIERQVAADLPLHYVDPDRLIQVIWNLLENAWKYAPSPSPLRVEAKRIENEVLIGVADCGPGIPGSEREKIFQRFYRLDRDHKAHTKGSGLGLAICRGIVEAHGGRIWVEDSSEGGSEFCIALPLPGTDTTELEGLEEQALFLSSIKEN
ncbi:MAG: ATP-binding protein, partial [Chloroflexota bacterium]|nr:ATP-binding protein [Chloroflexota bacterium]